MYPSVSVVYLGATSEYIVFSAYFGCISSVFSTYSNSRNGYIVFDVYFACILLYLVVSRPYSEIQCILNVFHRYPHVFFCILVSDTRIHSDTTYFGVSARIFFDEKKYV